MVGGELKKKDKYSKRVWNCEELLINPALDGSVLYGIEMKLSGNCVLLYLKDEVGLHHWKMSTTEDHTFVVEVSEKEISTPEKINRKEFYKGNPRRIFKAGHFKDNRYKITREVAKNQFSDLVLQILDDLFKAQLNSELF